MVKKVLPINPIVAWHAIFSAPITDGVLPYQSAKEYGQTIVDLGFCTTFFIVNKIERGTQWVHCLPYTGGSTQRFMHTILDKNWSSQYNVR